MDLSNQLRIILLSIRSFFKDDLEFQGVYLGGSSARNGTSKSGNPDLDIYVLFNSKNYISDKKLISKDVKDSLVKITGRKIDIFYQNPYIVKSSNVLESFMNNKIRLTDDFIESIPKGALHLPIEMRKN